MRFSSSPPAAKPKPRYIIRLLQPDRCNAYHVSADHDVGEFRRYFTVTVMTGDMTGGLKGMCVQSPSTSWSVCWPGAPHPPDYPATKSNLPNVERAAQEPRAQRLGVLNMHALENVVKKTSMIAATLVGAAVLSAAPVSIHWSQDKALSVTQDNAYARVGRPLTPVSVAGVHRRAVRRCAAGVTCHY